MKYSVVIPCYNSSHTIRDVVTLTADEFGSLGIKDFEFVLVDDFSPDGGATMEVLRSLAKEHRYVTVVELARNSGQHNAVLAGMNYACGDIIITMDDDMQTHPSQLSKLLSRLDEGYDVVYGYYPDKKHSAFRNFGTWVNYMTVRILIGKPKDMRTSSYCVMRKYVRDHMIEYHAQYAHLQGLVLRIVSPAKIASVPIEHFDRAYGTSNYTLKKLLGLWSNIAGFSIVPLQIAKRTGFAISLLGLIGAVVLIIRKFMHPNVVIGWASMIVAIFFFSGMLMFTLGIIGEYIGRMFLAMGNYPQFVVREVYNDHRSGRVHRGKDVRQDSHGSRGKDGRQDGQGSRGKDGRQDGQGSRGKDGRQDGQGSRGKDGRHDGRSKPADQDNRNKTRKEEQNNSENKQNKPGMQQSEQNSNTVPVKHKHHRRKKPQSESAKPKNQPSGV